METNNIIMEMEISQDKIKEDVIALGLEWLETENIPADDENHVYDYFSTNFSAYEKPEKSRLEFIQKMPSRVKPTIFYQKTDSPYQTITKVNFHFECSEDYQIIRGVVFMYRVYK